MTEAKDFCKIDFRRFELSDRENYERYLFAEEGRGCEFSFANLYLWGRQSFAEVSGQIVLFSQFDRRSVYPFPLGEGDKRAALDAIIADSRARGIPCRITGLDGGERALIEEYYPDKFRFHSDEGSFDYVYRVDDLALLAGRKYSGKRNHLNRFYEAHPAARAVPISDENIDSVRKMTEEWYEKRLSENPNADFEMERAALYKALRDYRELSMDGLVLVDGGTVLGFTLASRISSDTFDVHFEKALSEVQGAYPAINCALARYIREKYPEVKFLNREEDMGIEGLRRAKESYHPHHRVVKYWAHLLEEGYEY